MTRPRYGFSLVELLITLVIIGILLSLATFAFVGIRAKARDTKRKFELTQIGRFFQTSCYTPDSGPGQYDLQDLINEWKNKDDKYKNALSMKIRDPKSGTDDKSGYFYEVTADKKCVLWANLESNGEAITLPNLNNPTPGGGNGVLISPTEGPNGTNKYYQVSN